MHIKNIMKMLPLFLLSTPSPAKSETILKPRKLTVTEVLAQDSVELKTLLSPTTRTATVDQQISISKTVPLSHLPKGTHQEAGTKDAIRMPGTSWCGKGWRVDSAKSMGGYSGADRCCRHHDLGCSISIEPGQTRWGLTNVRIHTVMHCSCDERFRSCLKMARTQAADIVGNLFFNLADIPCFVFSKEQVTYQQTVPVLANLLLHQVCSARNWWGQCTQQQQEHRAVWRKPLPYNS